jgi:hypothetical protein
VKAIQCFAKFYYTPGCKTNMQCPSKIIWFEPRSWLRNLKVPKTLIKNNNYRQTIAISSVLAPRFVLRSHEMHLYGTFKSIQRKILVICLYMQFQHSKVSAFRLNLSALCKLPFRHVSLQIFLHFGAKFLVWVLFVPSNHVRNYRELFLFNTKSGDLQSKVKKLIHAYTDFRISGFRQLKKNNQKKKKNKNKTAWNVRKIKNTIAKTRNNVTTMF